MLPKLRWVLNVEDDDFFGGVVHRVVDEVSVFARHELAHTFRLLDATSTRKEEQVLQKITARTRCEAAGLCSRT